ncbi:MAG: epoxyqueuosine reductase [Treponema sp.]|nr:epoxyqueuosine reductase [Treponema sp.]
MTSSGSPDPERTLLLSRALSDRGVPSFGFASGERLAEILRGVPAGVAESYGLASARGVLAAALHYDTTGRPAGALDTDYFRGDEGKPLAALGWFARAHWYRELAGILAAVSRIPGLASAGPPGAFRIAVNSRLPEKALAVAAGLGPLGRNTLVLERLAGPGCVLGVLLLPFEPDIPEGARDPGSRPSDPEVPGSECGDCRECVRACPTGAVREEGGIYRLRCLQHWAGSEGPVPERIAGSWRGSLYGCDLCLAACPRFRPDVPREASIGLLGRGLNPDRLLGAEDGEIRNLLRGTALGLSWLSPGLIRRNARLARDSWERG